MLDYAIVSETVDGVKTRETLQFEGDDAAITYALPLARGRLLEIWRSGKLVAAVDERPCTPTVRRASNSARCREFAFA